MIPSNSDNLLRPSNQATSGVLGNSIDESKFAEAIDVFTQRCIEQPDLSPENFAAEYPAIQSMLEQVLPTIQALVVQRSHCTERVLLLAD